MVNVTQLQAPRHDHRSAHLPQRQCQQRGVRPGVHRGRSWRYYRQHRRVSNGSASAQCQCSKKTLISSESVSDDLSELESEAVPDEVRKWLASTFAKQEQHVRRKDERPTFRSVANAIRTGIFIEKIYRRMSTSQLMIIPENLDPHLKVVMSLIKLGKLGASYNTI